MKILKFNKKICFLISLVFIAIACLLVYLNKLSYNRYLEMKQEYVEVDCIVIEVDDIKHTIKVAYAYDNIEYYAIFETIEYKLMDSFTGVIKPNEPTKLRFDNGYSHWNIYTYTAILLTGLALLFNLVIIKRSLVRYICMKNEKITTKIIEIKTWHSFRILVIEHNGKKYKSEIFKTFDNISLLEENTEIDFYKKGLLHYIDLFSYKKIR